MATLISEKAAEILFIRYLLQTFGLGEAQLFAPTLVEEYHAGHDGRVTSTSNMREVYLQFKAPSISGNGAQVKIKLTPHQHTRLRLYPTGTAFYVAAMFSTLKDFNCAQITCKFAVEFRRNFICIDASQLFKDAKSITFDLPASHRHAPNARYKTSTHSKSPKDCVPLNGATWMRGSTLSEKLKTGGIGTLLLSAANASSAYDHTAVDEPNLYDAKNWKEWILTRSFIRVPEVTAQ